MTEAALVEGPGADAPGPSPLRRVVAQARTRAAIPWWVLAVGLLGSSVMWLVLGSKLWFFWDTWDFILYRGPAPSFNVGIWQPHNEHWSTLPILLFRSLFSMFGLKHHMPYVVPLIVMHLVICLAIVWLLRRSGVSSWTVVGVTLIIAFLGNGAENLEWEFQIGFVGSAMFGLLTMILLSTGRIGRWRIVSAWGLLICGLMSSGVGVTMVGCAALLVLIRRGVFRAVAVAAVPAVVFLVWYLTYGRHAAPTHPSLRDLALIPRYVWTGLTDSWERTVGIPGSGALFVLVLFGTVLVAGLKHPVALSLTVGAAAQLTMTGFVRVQFGVDQAGASRYAYLICVYTSLALGIALDAFVRRLGRPRWFTGAIVGAVCLAVIANGVGLAVAYMTATRPTAYKERDTVLGAMAISKSGQRLLSNVPDPGFVFITVDALKEIADKIPDGQPSPQGYVDVASNLLVGQGALVDDLPLATGVAVWGLSAAGSASGGCQDYVTTGGEEMIAVTIGQQGGRVVLTVPGPNIKTRLEYGTALGAFTDRTLPTGQPVSVGTTSRGGVLDIWVPAKSSVTICKG